MADYNVSINALIDSNVIKRQTAVVTVKLTGMKVFRFRLWLALRIFRLGAWMSKGIVRVDNA